MLVTFRTKAYADITMFGDVAKQLLGMMGLSGTVPSALMAEDVPAALAELRSSVRALPEEPEEPEEPKADAKEQEKNEAHVPIARRAFPLIGLLEAAEKAQADVTWR
jgi:hypothetical protein